MTRRENLHSLYVLLFLNIAFFFIQTQAPERYMNFFSFQRDALLRGEVWRLFTYQFIQGGALSLFFNLLILYIMGSVVEEEWGTGRFLTFYALSVLGSAAVAFVFNFPLIGAFFLSYSLLFAYAHMLPEQTFYIFFVLPVKVKWLAWLALGILIYGLLTRAPSSLGAAGGAILSMSYYFFRIRQQPVRRIRVQTPRESGVVPVAGGATDKLADENLASFQTTRRLAETGSSEERQERIAALSKKIVPGVNICPPADFKPQAEDRYCVRCEGFNECSARWLRLQEDQQAKTANG